MQCAIITALFVSGRKDWKNLSLLCPDKTKQVRMHKLLDAGFKMFKMCISALALVPSPSATNWSANLFQDSSNVPDFQVSINFPCYSVACLSKLPPLPEILNPAFCSQFCSTGNTISHPGCSNSQILRSKNDICLQIFWTKQHLTKTQRGPPA